MSIFSDLPAEIRKQVIDSQKLFVLEQMYIFCLRIGINPETFVPGEYVEVDFEDAGKNSNQQVLMSQIELYLNIEQAENSLNVATPS